MKNVLLCSSLLLLISEAVANNISPTTSSALEQQEQLKEMGRAIANYQRCSALAVESGDKVMASYYADMLEDSAIALKAYQQEQQQQIQAVQEKSAKILVKLNYSTMLKLCEQRLDAVSRQHYQQQLKSQQPVLFPYRLAE